MGGWTGTVLTAVSGTVAASGTARMVRQRRTISGIIERITDFDIDAFETPRAIEITGIGDAGPCRAFNGEEGFYEDLKERGINARYLHSDIKTLDRIQLLTEFRRGSEEGGFDCLVGVNLLREGLDLPEVSFIGILDADKEGFLRSETSLIQTIGRAARNAAGYVILYADALTGSMERAINETSRRRTIQLAYNKKHGITPQTIRKSIKDITESFESLHGKTVLAELTLDKKVFGKDKKKLIRGKVRQMNEAVKKLDFETAAILRDEIKALDGK